MSPSDQRLKRPAWFQPIEWIHICFFILLLVFKPCLPCLEVDIWGNRKDMWKWRRIWKSNDKVEKEERIRRERCCANDRDDWRERARRQGLMPQKPNALRCVRQSRYWVRTSILRFLRRLGDTKLNNYLSHTPLFKLPPEVREQIYVYYMLEWSSAGLERQINRTGQAARRPIPPHEPPLTRVSKLVRAESLHVFYRTARFPLIVHPTRTWGPLDLPFPVVDWYHFLGPGKLSLIRRLELHLCLRRSAAGIADSLVFHVDFEQNGNNVSLVEAPWALDELCRGSWGSEHMQQFVNELFLKFTSVAHGLGGAGIVSAKDIYQFVS